MSLPGGFARLPSGPLILASASTARRGLLERAGFAVACQPATIDEDLVRASQPAKAWMPAKQRFCSPK